MLNSSLLEVFAQENIKLMPPTKYFRYLIGVHLAMGEAIMLVVALHIAGNITRHSLPAIWEILFG